MFRPQKIIAATATVILVKSAPGALSMHRIGSAAVGNATSKTSGHVPCHGARQLENNPSPQSTAMKNLFAIAIWGGTADATMFIQTSGHAKLGGATVSFGVIGDSGRRESGSPNLRLGSVFISHAYGSALPRATPPISTCVRLPLLGS
jgi:hypothetical protein